MARGAAEKFAEEMKALGFAPEEFGDFLRGKR